MRRLLLSVPATLAFIGAATLPPVAAQETSHPAGIYVGTCPTPGNLAVSLWDASSSFLVEGDASAGEPVGAQFGFPVEASVTIVEMSLADLATSDHAILVHRSQGEMDDYLACGDVGGLMMGADELPVALSPVGLSPWSGVAILDDEGDGTTTVSIYVFEGPGIDTGGGQVPLGPVPSPFPDETFDDRPVVTATPRDDDVDDRDDDDAGDGTGDDDDTGSGEDTRRGNGTGRGDDTDGDDGDD